MNIGYIGLGSLGAPIAQCIARSGFALTVYDIVPAAMEAFDNRAASPQACAAASDLLCVCVRTDQDMIELTQDGSVFAALSEGGVFVIHSTIAPELAVALADQAKTYGVSVVDCGVSRGGAAVVDGDLSIYLGGDTAAVEKARPLLDCLGRWQHLGPVGRGMQGKLLNNLVSIANYGMSAHILELGEHLGFDRDQLKNMLMAGSAQGFALRVAPNFVLPERAPNMLNLLGKDVQLAKSLADPDHPSMRALVNAAESMVSLLATKVEAHKA